MPDSHLHILFVLAEGDAHEYRIMTATETLTGGTVKLRLGALHSALGRLVDNELIIETKDRRAAKLDDQRRRYYRITQAGRDTLGAEIRRLARLVDHAIAPEPNWAVG